MNTLPLKASGMVFKNGYYTPEQFQAITTVNPMRYPQYFLLSRTGLVILRDKYIRECDEHFSNVRQNWHSIGVTA